MAGLCVRGSRLSKQTSAPGWAHGASRGWAGVGGDVGGDRAELSPLPPPVRLPGICLGQSGLPSRTTAGSAPGGGIRDDLVQVSVRGAEKSGRWALAGGGLGRGRRVLRARARPVPPHRRGRREGDRTPLRAPALSRTPRPQETLVFQSENWTWRLRLGRGKGSLGCPERGIRLAERGSGPGGSDQGPAGSGRTESRGRSENSRSSREF